jgi:hypothetical protein
VVRILEAAGESLRQQGSAVTIGDVTQWNNGHGNGNGNGNGNGYGNHLPGIANRSMVAA